MKLKYTIRHADTKKFFRGWQPLKDRSDERDAVWTNDRDKRCKFSTIESCDKNLRALYMEVPNVALEIVPTIVG